MKAKKSYGQHFLTDQEVILKIANLVLNCGNESVLEIGPGKAAITKHLLDKISDFRAVDSDRDMFEFLVRKYPNHKDVFIHSDFLKMDLNPLFSANQFVIFGNFPYNISSQIVFKMLECRERVPILLGMFQKEMAMRIVATEGTKDYGILSVLSSLNYKSEILFDIAPTSFNPPPKVMSSFIQMVRKDLLPEHLIFRKVHRLVKTAFQFRRKTLRNNLKSIPGSSELLKNDYYNQRPEQISPEEYLRLAALFYPD